MRSSSLLLLLFVAGPLAAQSSDASIDPGMTHSQVVQRLGPPASERAARGLTVLYYANGCERRCGTPDVIFLERGAVVDAIFRSPARHYTGTSSSAYAIPAASARAGRATVGIAEPSRVLTNVRSIVVEPSPGGNARPVADPARGANTP
jgi:hypothetical protein